MINNNSPLETLAAFAIVFVAGVVSTAGLGAYISGLRRKAATQAIRHRAADHADPPCTGAPAAPNAD